MDFSIELLDELVSVLVSLDELCLIISSILNIFKVLSSLGDTPGSGSCSKLGGKTNGAFFLLKTHHYFFVCLLPIPQLMRHKNLKVVKIKKFLSVDYFFSFIILLLLKSSTKIRQKTPIVINKSATLKTNQ